MKAFFAIFDIVPSWVWAALLAGAALVNCATHAQLQSKRVEAANLKTEAANRAKVQAEVLSAEVEKVRDTEKKLAQLALKQEKTDANNKELTRQAGADLAGSLVDGRLRDPNAASCGDQPQANDTARAGAGDKDGAQATGLLSRALTELLTTDSADADAINLAYTSCRDSSRALRKVLKEQE